MYLAQSDYFIEQLDKALKRRPTCGSEGPNRGLKEANSGSKEPIWKPNKANSGLKGANLRLSLRLKEDRLGLKGANSGLKLAKLGGLDRPNPGSKGPTQGSDGPIWGSDGPIL